MRLYVIMNHFVARLRKPTLKLTLDFTFITFKSKLFFWVQNEIEPFLQRIQE